MSTPQQLAVKSYLRRFPKAATKTLAKTAFRISPELWPTENACYLAFRRARGSLGKHHRKAATDKSNYQPPRKSGWAFGKLPEGLREIDSVIGHQLNGPACVLILSDTHIPYHDKLSLELAIKEARQREITTILLNGDIIDCHAISHWQVDPRERDFKFEVETTRQFLSMLRVEFPQAKIIYKWGNHEDRFQSYMILKAPELLDIDDFRLSNILGCHDSYITTVEERQVVRLGKLSVIHGHEYRFSISNPVNPARGLFLRSRVNAMCGHFHQVSHHAENDMAGNITSCWSLGCLCDLHPRYMPLNKWVHGFAIVEVEENGAFSVESFRVIDGKIWR